LQQHLQSADSFYEYYIQCTVTQVVSLLAWIKLYSRARYQFCSIVQNSAGHGNSWMCAWSDCYGTLSFGRSWK